MWRCGDVAQTKNRLRSLSLSTCPWQQSTGNWAHSSAPGPGSRSGRQQASVLWCRRPGGHMASDLHATRCADADRQFIVQHGELASIIHATLGWLIDPRGRARD